MRDILKQNRELVAAQTGSGVALAQGGGEARGDRLQYTVARVVTESVVDVLEIVEVEKQNGRRTTSLPRRLSAVRRDRGTAPGSRGR